MSTDNSADEIDSRSDTAHTSSDTARADVAANGHLGACQALTTDPSKRERIRQPAYRWPAV